MRLFFSTSSATRPTGLERCLHVVLLLGASAALSACSSVSDKLPSVSGLVTPYKIDILQGNVVTREQVQALQPGMSRDQVKGILGSSLLSSVFHADRWDYVFTFRRQGQPPQQRRLTVFFKGDVMDRTEADELPSETEFVSSLDNRRRNNQAPVLEATDAQLKAFDARNTPAAAAPAQSVAPATSYPPLETSGGSR